MASVGIAALGGALSLFISTIQTLGNNHFAADAAWKEFPLRVRLLQKTHDSLEEKLEKYAYGQHHDSSASVLEVVKDAKRLLDGEVAALEKSSRKWLPGVLFRESVAAHIAVAEGAYSKVLDHLNSQLQNDDVLRETAQRRAFRPPFRNDSRYVPFQVSEMKIFSALEGARREPAVVLLSGGPGKGKSTLARQVSLRYGEENSRFTHVVMLECGPKIDVAAKQTELLQKLGGDMSQQSQGDDIKVLKALQDRLSNPRMLIVLDDLWEHELIRTLINLSGSGSGAKYLITSQLGNICASLNCGYRECVQIEDLNQEHARKILAMHAGFANQDIPQHLQEVADKIIDQTEANPLVIATLGAQITNAGQDNVDVWESVSEDLFELLDNRTNVDVHGVGYERTFWATMKLSIETLSHEQKQLVVLMAMCRGASISKSVLQFLYGIVILRGACKKRDFLILSNELKSRHLLAEKDTDFLSIHSLTRGFILEHMQEAVKDMTTLLNEANYDVKEEGSNPNIRTSINHILVCLYIDAEFSARATVQIDHFLDLHMSSQFNTATIDTKKTISESIMELLVLEARPRYKWTEELSICAKQVLMEFFCNDLLCDGDISELLSSPSAIIPIMTFLKNVCLLGESFWKNNHFGSTASIPHSLLDILQDDSCGEHHTRVALVLAGLCWCYKDNAETIANVPGMLPQLALLLAQFQNPDLQRSAAIALSACAYWDDDGLDTMIPKILDVHGLMSSLVDLLAEDANSGVQIAVAHTLSNLASAEPVTIKETIVRQPRLLAMLGDSLLRSERPQLQEYAARTVANLVPLEEQPICKKITRYPGLVEKLVSSLYEDHNPVLQEQAARALRKLAATETCRDILGRRPEVLEGLAKSLIKSRNPVLQETAAATLAYIADTESDDTLKSLVNHPGLVDDVLKSLHEYQNSGLQEEVARALSNLARYRAGSSIFDELMDWPGLLEGLAQSSVDVQNPLLLK